MATNYALSGSVTLTIGTKEVTLDSGDLNSTPIVYHLPADEVPSVTLEDVVGWFNQSFGQSVQVPDFISSKVDPAITIGALYVSSAGDLDLTTKLTLKGPDGLEIFSGLKINSLGLKLKRTPDAAILSFSPATAKAGEQVKIGGTGLAGVTGVKVGDVALAATDLIVNTDNNFLTIKLPVGVLAGPQTVTVTGAAGTFTNPATLVFTVGS